MTWSVEPESNNYVITKPPLKLELIICTITSVGDIEAADEHLEDARDGGGVIIPANCSWSRLETPSIIAFMRKKVYILRV